MKKLILISILFSFLVSGCSTILDISKTSSNGITELVGITLFDETKEISGVSFIFGDNITYVGDYSAGLWFDKNTVNLNKDGNFGIKFDIVFGNLVRPIGNFWEPGFWTHKPVFNDIAMEEWNSYFGERIGERLKHINPKYYKHPINNPWFGKHFMVLRIPKFIPLPFFSIGTPWFNFYIGMKTYKCNPLIDTIPYWGSDATWTNNIDIERVKRLSGKDYVNYICPSIRSTSNRHNR